MSAIVWCLLIDDLSHIISRLSVLLELACRPTGQSAGWPARHLTSKREADRHIVYVIVSLIMCIHIPIAVKSALNLLNVLDGITCTVKPGVSTLFGERRKFTVARLFTI